MFVKKKHISVIFWSSTVVAVIFISTLAVYNLYFHWKENRYYSQYRDTIQDLNAKMFSDTVVLDQMEVTIAKSRRDHALGAILRGTLVNNSSKTLNSALLEVNFKDYRGEVLHKTWIYLLSSGVVSGYAGAKFNDMVEILKPGESFTFRHNLQNCPTEILASIDQERGFARGREKDKVYITYAICGLDIL